MRAGRRICIEPIPQSCLVLALGSPDPVVEVLQDQHLIRAELGLDQDHITGATQGDEVDESSATESPRRDLSQDGVLEKQRS